MKVRLAPLSSRGASGWSPTKRLAVIATRHGELNAHNLPSRFSHRPSANCGNHGIQAAHYGVLSLSLCLGGISLLHTAPDRQTTALPFEDGAATPGPMTLASARPGLNVTTE